MWCELLTVSNNQWRFTNMVAVFPEPDSQQTNLFSYLKPCQPAPGIAQRVSELIASDPLNQPVELSRKQRRWLSLVGGALQVAAIGLGLWLPSLWAASKVEPNTATQMSSDERLWNTLTSDELADVLLTAKEKQADENLAKAEQERLQAQQLRIDAETRAYNLTEQAAERAKQTGLDAMRQADRIALDATYIGAEQVIHAKAGAAVTLKFTAQIQCQEGSFGETAISTPKDPRITPREVRNLAVCYPQAETAAGNPIGQAGDLGIAFFKME
jgi:hypothetical protein